VLPLLAGHGAASTLWPHAIQRRLPRRPSGVRAVPRPVCAWSAGRNRRRWWWVAHAGDGGDTGLDVGTRYARLWAFPAYAALDVGWVFSSPHAEDTAKKDD